MNDSAGLSKRQIDCLKGVAELRTPEQIADRLGISAHTVNGHLKAARGVLGATSSRDAVLKYQLRTGEFLTGQITAVAETYPSLDQTSGTNAVREAPASPFVIDEASAIPPCAMEETRSNDLGPRALRTFGWIIATAVAIVVLLLAVQPLTDSAMSLANSIQPHRR